MNSLSDGIDLAGFGENELMAATGAELATVRSWLQGESPVPVGLRRALEIFRTFERIGSPDGANELDQASATVPKIPQSERQPQQVSGGKGRSGNKGSARGMATAQTSLFDNIRIENEAFLKTQLITYIGNKRSLLPFIETGIRFAKQKIGKDQIDFLDLFSGSGVVARMARQHSRELHCNDLELYSEVVNSCYQTNATDLDADALSGELDRLRSEVRDTLKPGFIAELYAPEDDEDIKRGERVFYTRRNAAFLDTFCRALATTPSDLRPYVLAPILSQASMHANTSGVFKGFYKNQEGVGQFGGTFKNALTRIKRNIEVQAPVFSSFTCSSTIHRSDANALVKELDAVDIAYFDPPYNQHPYGSNYFMLNLLCDYQRPKEVSNVSGIPAGWNRSLYNKAQHAEAALFDAVENVRAKFVLISYNSEGFVPHDRFLSELVSLGEVSVMDTKYNTFRGCRNLSGRDIHVTENLYLIDKR